MKRWPALIIPPYLEGVYTVEAGVVRVKTALKAFQEESMKNGAELHYNSHVEKIDHENGIVTLDNGETYRAKNIVITCGATTD